MNQAADNFVTEFSKNPDTDFIVFLCASGEHSINHLIWRGVVFPFIKQELEKNPVAIKCLIQTIHNLYSDRTAHAELAWVTEHQLTNKYLTYYPADQWATAKKRDLLSQWLAFTIHEWPNGVLYGMDGATLEQCDEIIVAVEELRAVDAEKRYEELCKDVIEKTTLYRERLANIHCTGARKSGR